MRAAFTLFAARYFGNLRHVKAGIEVDLILGVCGEAFFIIVVCLGFEPELLIHLADDEIYTTGFIFFLQQRRGFGKVSHHIVQVALHLIEVCFFQQKRFFVGFVELFLLQKVYCGLRVIVFLVFCKGADKVKNSLVACFGVLAILLVYLKVVIALPQSML